MRGQFLAHQWTTLYCPNWPFKPSKRVVPPLRSKKGGQAPPTRSHQKDLLGAPPSHPVERRALIGRTTPDSTAPTSSVTAQSDDHLTVSTRASVWSGVIVAQPPEALAQLTVRIRGPSSGCPSNPVGDRAARARAHSDGCDLGGARLAWRRQPPPSSGAPWATRAGSRATRRKRRPLASTLIRMLSGRASLLQLPVAFGGRLKVVGTDRIPGGPPANAPDSSSCATSATLSSAQWVTLPASRAS